MTDVLRFRDQFHRPGPQSPVTWKGRSYFLEDVQALKPRVIRELLRIHLRARRGLVEQIEQEIENWAARWRLTPVDPVHDHWPRAVALATLALWREYPEIIERRWAFPSHAAPFAFNKPEEAAYARARRGKRGRAPFQKLARQRGFKATPILRERQAFRRLALFQVCGWSLTELSGELSEQKERERQREAKRLRLDKIDKRTVREALARTAGMIGLELRDAGKPGRPSTTPRARRTTRRATSAQ